MKKIVIASAVALVVGFVSGAVWRSRPVSRSPAPGVAAPAVKESGPTATEATPAPAGFALKPARHDFGRLREGETRSVTLGIERPEGQALRLGRLYSACPCIHVQASPLSFEAGKPAVVSVSIHSLTLDGKKTFPVYVELLEPVKCVLRADVEAEVERVPARIALNPETFHLGAVAADKTATVRLTNLTAGSLHLLELSCSLPGATVDAAGSKIVPAGQTVELKLAVKAGALKPGPVRSEVTVRTDCPLHAQISIPIDGTASK